MIDVALYIVNSNYDPDKDNKIKDTPLLWACYNNMKEVALKILDINNKHGRYIISGITLKNAVRNNMEELIIKMKQIELKDVLD
jgi:ankyrin repeat protein